MEHIFSFERLWKVIPQLTPYIGISIRIVLYGLVLGSLLGMVVAVIRIKRIPVIHQILSVYISFMRGTSMLVQMMLIYYGLPMLLLAVGIDINSWDKMTFVYMTFILNEGAFLGELFRAAIESVPAEQTEAGYSVGLTGAQTFLRIVLPQAVKTAIPGYGVDVIGMFQNTSIAFTLGVVDLIGRAKTIGTAMGHELEAYVYVAFLYIVVSILFRILFHWIDKRYSFGREGVAG
ncbi:MAG: amino acid ABC transporter permease [Lachnospiraceae bacterium]|nr:amino acid ABC transporter permease [Lachnospiraceae bacterium]